MMNDEADRIALVGMLFEWGRIVNEEPRKEMERVFARGR